jgi:hypothetical protein
MIFAVIEGLRLSPDHYFGYERDRKGKRHILTSLTTIWTFAANCYHGGRNEAYRVGLTPQATPLFDVDLKSAYTTALALAQVPDWDSAAPDKNIERLAVIDHAMTLARVRFQFPEDTRFPSLPVRGGDRGLIYPLQGVSWCTGAEIVVALSQGAQIVVEEGWRVEWIEGSPRPFETFTRLINTTRKAAKESGDALLSGARRLQVRRPTRRQVGRVRALGQDLYGTQPRHTQSAQQSYAVAPAVARGERPR